MLVNMIYRGQLTLPESAKKTRNGYYCFEENGRAWRVRYHSAYCYVENVEIAFLEHNFGTYTVKLTGYATGSEYTIEGEAHPHVHRGRCCWGDLYEIAHRFLGDNDVEGFAGIAERLLRSYDSRAPYAGWWRNIAECTVCQGRIEGRENVCQCGDCGAIMCRACAIRCKADLIWCKECLPCYTTACAYSKRCQYHVGNIRKMASASTSADESASNDTYSQDPLPF